jgi:hypothetical protein
LEKALNINKEKENVWIVSKTCHLFNK